MRKPSASGSAAWTPSSRPPPSARTISRSTPAPSIASASSCPTERSWRRPTAAWARSAWGLLSRVRAIRFNERHPAGLEGLALGLAARPAVERERARVFEGAAGERLDALEGADVVIVDPPRKGLDDALLERLRAAPPRRLIYLACGLPALERELPRLVRPGGLRCAGVEAFDFFPFTEHVETLVWLDRDGEHSPPAVPRPS